MSKSFFDKFAAASAREFSRQSRQRRRSGGGGGGGCLLFLIAIPLAFWFII